MAKRKPKHDETPGYVGPLTPGTVAHMYHQLLTGQARSDGIDLSAAVGRVAAGEGTPADKALVERSGLLSRRR